MPEQTSQITITSDLLKRDPSYKEVVDQIEKRLYDRYMVYLSDKPKFNAKTQDIPKQYLFLILSFKNTLELNKAASKHKLSQDQRDKIPEILWKIFYKEAEIKNLPQMLNSELGLNNIHTAYLLAVDIANIYLPISDYLGDIPMVIKRWQYELPAEVQPATDNLQPATPKFPPQKVAQPQAIQQPTPVPAIENLPVAEQITPPPIRQAQPESTTEQEETQADKPIPKVQEIMSRISQKSLPSSPAQRLSELTNIPQKQTPWEEHHEKISQETKTPAPEQSGHSDLEPEYLPNNPPAQIQPLENKTEAQINAMESPSEPQKPTNPENIIDLKNF